MVVRGKDGLLYIFDSGVWKLIACARSVSLNVMTAFIETSVAGAGVWATYLPTKNSFTGTADGVVNINEVGMLGLPDLRQKQISQVPLLMRFQRTDTAGNVYTDEAVFYISGSNDVSSFDNVAIFNLTFQGSGLIVLTFQPVVPVPVGGVLVKRYEYVSIGTAEQGVTLDGSIMTLPNLPADLRNKYILEVNIDGISQGPIITGGTPVGTEVKYISATGQFSWPIPFEVNEEMFILYQ